MRMYVLQTMRPESASGLLQTGHEWEKVTVRSQFPDMTSLLIFFNVVLFLLSSLV